MSLSLIIPIVVLVVSVVILIWFFPFILLFFTKLFYGKYSSYYLLLHKKYMGTNPYGYCIKDDFINHLAGFYKDQKNLDSFQTSKDISFDNAKFGEKFSQVMNRKKNLICMNSTKMSGFDLKVAGFRSEMFDYDVKVYYYFANNRFFMGEYSFKLVDKKRINLISSLLQQKYLESVKVADKNLIIEKSNQATIYMENNGFRLFIRYLWQEDEVILKLLREYWDSVVRLNVGPSDNFERELVNIL